MGARHPNEFGVWFAKNYHQRNEYLNEPRFTKKWKEDDFKQVEYDLLKEALDVEVDYMSMMPSWGYRARLKRKLEEMRGKDA